MNRLYIFISKNWFRFILLTCILLVSLSITHYYLFYAPKQNKALISEKKQEECKKMAYDLYKADVKESTEPSTFITSKHAYIQDPKFFYNIDLDRCFYHVRIDTFLGSYNTVNETIVDTKTNEIIARYHWDSSMDKEIETDKQANEEFGTIYEKYMPNAKNYKPMH